MNNDSADRLPLLTPDQLNLTQKHLYDRMEKEQVPWATKAGFQAATPDGKLLGAVQRPAVRPGSRADVFGLLHSREKEHVAFRKRPMRL